MPTHFTEYLLYALYFLVGPAAWGLYAIGMYQAQKRMFLIKEPQESLPEPPRVSILIPAKDEGERIRDCLATALGQNYPNFNVIAIDDRSTDRTGVVMDEMAAANPKLKVVHIQEGSLPPGWTGKNNALANGVQNADSDWLLFVDSDVLLEPMALSATVSVCVKKRFDLISLIPKMETHTLWEGLLIPLCAATAAAVHAAALTNTNSVNTAFANGQFMLIRREAYESIGGHASVKDNYCEDMGLARLLKRNGFRPRVSWGTNLCQVRMYDSFPKILRGWSRIFMAAAVGRPWKSLAAMLFILVCCYSVYPAFAWGVYRFIYPIDVFKGWGWMLTAAGHFTLMTVQIGLMYKWMLNPRRYALLFPVSGAILLYILARAVWMCITKKVEWRGTSYSHRMETSTAGAK